MVPPLARFPFLALALAPFLSANLQAQESKAFFDAPIDITGNRDRFESVVDMNGDGYADAIAVWWEGVTYSQIHLHVFLNDQHGKLEPGYPINLATTPALPNAVSPWHVATGDLSNDGLPEVLIGIGQRVHVFHSLGFGVVHPQGYLPLVTSGIVDGVRIDDFDGDGVLDVAVLDGSLTLYHVDPVSLSFTAFSSIALGTTDAQLHPVEMNGDGAPDLMVTDATNVLLCPIVAGQLQQPLAFPHQCGFPKPAAGDIDGDGDQDVVVWDMSQYTVLRRTGPTTFAPEYGKIGGPARFLYDLDGDGDLDGVCCGGGGGPTQLFNNDPSIFRLAFNDGHGNFAPALEMPGLGSFKLAGAADLDHDGDLDLVAGRCVFYAHGPWQSVAAPTHTHFEPRLSQIVDFDGDADVDLELRPVAVQRNFGNGRPQTLVPQLPPPPPGETWAIGGNYGSYTGDFDGDGDVDMIVAHYSGLPAGVSLSLLWNDGGGHFTLGGSPVVTGSMSSFNGTPESLSSFTVDIDGDGDLDIVAGSSTLGDDDTRLWANDGQGHFTLAALIQPGRVLAVADMNGDGINDLVGHFAPYFGSSSDRAGTWRGLGNNTFAAPQAFAPVIPMAEILPSMSVADVDGDGDLDVCMGDANGSLHVMTNHQSEGVTDMGNTQFTSTTFPAGYLLASSTTNVFDVDGDGLVDIVSGPLSGAVNSSAIWIRNHDNSGWQPAVVQVLRAPATADMDGDGDIDAVGSNVWLNTRISGPNASSCLQTATGTPDTNGITPTLGGKGPFHVGNAVDLRITGAPPQSNGVVLVTVGTPPPTLFGTFFSPFSPRSSMLVHLHTSGIPGQAGTGMWRLPFTVPNYAAGTTRTYEALFADPLVPGGFVRSNKVAIHYVP